jgi:hypothetical protein
MLDGFGPLPLGRPSTWNSLCHSRVFFNVPQMPAVSYNLRYVARNLRYLAVPELTSETVTLRSLPTMTSDVINLVGPRLPGLTTTPIHDFHQIETPTRQVRILGFLLAGRRGSMLGSRDQGIHVTFASRLFDDRAHSH